MHIIIEAPLQSCIEIGHLHIYFKVFYSSSTWSHTCCQPLFTVGAILKQDESWKIAIYILAIDVLLSIPNQITLLKVTWTKCTFPPLYSAEYPPNHYTEYKIDTTSYLFNHLKNNKWIAIIAQLAPTYGLSRSPIRLIFQKNPDIPVRFNLVSPGCNVYNTEDNGRHRWEMNNIKLSSQQQL